MEGCPRLPAIGFDPKVSIESVNLCEKIPSYITSTYQEAGDKYSNECEQMNRLRQNTINSSADQSGIQLLKRYYCQLQLLRNRFPMLPETECAVRFTWEDAYQKEDNSYSDIRFEEACILYNLGAMYSRLGVNESRKTHDSIKNACTYFRCAAACYEKVRDQYTTYTSDMTPDLLTCQIHILLAQAHEAVLEKSLLDQRAPSVNAHIAMQISEFYQMALLNLTKPGINSIISKKFREWRVSLTYKLSYYLAITYYFSGLVAEENKKYGQSVCYYEAGVERLKEAWKNAEKISSDKANVFKDAHTFTNDVVMGKYKVAKRDNDSVYFEKVPALSSLPAVQGAIVAKSQPFDCHDPEVCGTDIFQKLVPLDAHLAASEYSEEKAKLLREIIELTENKNRELETFMLCLQLDRVPLNNEYLRLPRELLDCCAAVAARPNMSKDLVSAMQQLNSQHHDVAEQIDEFEQSLKTLEETNDSIKSTKEFKDLQPNLKTTRDMMLQANESNIELHRHMTTIIEHLKILQSPLEQLEKTLPVITELDDETNKPKLARLALLNEKIETMKKQREMLVNDFRKKIHDDDITKLVLMQRQENHKPLFSDQVKKHEELVNIIKQNCAAQDNILQLLTEANADIADVRTKVGTTFETRNQLIQEYITSFKSFEDTLSKAHEGIEFYKKQSVKLMKLIDRLTTLQSQHQPPIPARPSLHRQVSSPRSSHHSPLPTWSNQDISEPNLPSAIPDRPRLKDYLAAMKPERWGPNTGRSSKRPPTNREDNLYIPPPMSNIGDNSNFYSNTLPPSSSPHSYSTGPTLTSQPTFNPHHYQPQSPTHFEKTPMPYVPSPTQTPSFPPQHSVSYQQPKYNQPISTDTNPNLSRQNFSEQSQMTYNPSPSQQFAQHQQFYSSHPTVPFQQTFHQPSPPPPPQQQQQQPVHQLPPTQQMFHQPPVSQQTFHQPPAQQLVHQPTSAQQTYHQPSSNQQTFHQSSLPQQPAYQPPQQPVHQLPPTQQFAYQPPPPPQQQSFHPSLQQTFQQPIYNNAIQQPAHSSYPQQTNHQSTVQPPQTMPSQQPVYQSTLPQPTVYQNQNLNDPNRPAQQVLPQTKFDPYRPQPVGAYDIPKSQNIPFTSAPSPSALPSSSQQQQQQQPQQQQHQQMQQQHQQNQQQQMQHQMQQQHHQQQIQQQHQQHQLMQQQQLQQQVIPPPTTHVNPQDVYRPGGLLSTNPPQVPSSSINNNNYESNQSIQHALPPTLVPSPATTKSSTNTVSNQSFVPKIDDDLLSLALEQQLETTLSTHNTEPNSPEPQPISPMDDELQIKSNGKPIACIQPLSMIIEDKQSIQPSVTPVSSMSPPQDLYDDKDKLEQFVADVQRFEKHVSTMTKKILNGTVPLEVEWKELSDLQEKEVHTQTCAIGKCNSKLNRFQDLIPYDNSRVRLTQTNSNQQKHFNDYINATSIGRIRDTSFIIAQYPLSTTIGDFWSMIYDQHVAIVAVLLRLDEMQSLNVYPQKVGEELRLSSFTITLLSTKSPNQLTNHRILRVHHLQTNQSRTVIWLEHLGWPPKDMPDNPVELLKFIQEVEHFLIQSRNPRSTILVTCLNGVSRTGPFLSLFTSIQDIDEARSFPDLNKIIRLLRTKRRHIIQDMNQLKFVYESLLRYVQERLVKRGVLNASSIIHHQSTIPTLKSTSPNTNTALLADEMQTIMDKAKPIIQPTPNYDVGPILSSTPTSTMIEEKPSIKQLTPIEENFNLRPEESHIKLKTTRDDFFRTKPSSVTDLSDPFNKLDPLWTFR
ncbi:unnamed protein product [Adineta steineri]|uniref:Tyrosine-protein phosphatase non-receptor type 23 n=1 Tax=Adineta steineri TaxID=433720 RepID=A0A814TN19_9BILA|nr:unnamed protein product [Adineta steineri]CAF1164548.1 unnamed protein product [Adineta steineri]CAF1521446.1 unnamed protein product [Adineta steineri]